MHSNGSRSGLEPGSIVTIFGASGFLGRHVVRVLAGRGYRIRAAVRRPNLGNFLKPMGELGQIELFQANIRDDQSCRRAIEGAAAVVNLVGLLHEAGPQRFDAIQAQGAARLARLSAAAGVGTFVQLSAIGADATSRSAYARSKAEGEAAVLAAMPQATIIRPSVMFGPEDDFFNRFAALARLLPALPLIGGGATRFQPVYVEDVAQAVGAALERPECEGKVLELGGPEILNFRELLELILRQTDRQRFLVPLPFPLAKVVATFLGHLPGRLLTRDQVELLKVDNVVGDEAIRERRTLEGLGIRPASLHAIVPAYLYRFRRTGQFHGRVEG